VLKPLTRARLLAGRVVEEIVYGEDEITTGASNDIEKVTATSKAMVMKYGMSEKLGPRALGHDQGNPQQNRRE
jgi:cell division protease FtsH